MEINMTPNQEELRKEFEAKFKHTDKNDTGYFPVYRTDEVIDFWLSKLDQASRLERAIESLGDKFGKLVKEDSHWYAYDMSRIHCLRGSTAFQALKNLRAKLGK